jgi:EpsI family protein
MNRNRNINHMHQQLRRSLWMLLVMSAAAGSVPLLHPKPAPVVQRHGPRIEAIFPAEFAGWRIDRTVAPVLPAPELEKKLGKIYDETVARTYVNALGERVMLSVAYGSNQTGKLRVHRPESCYTAQGFNVQKLREQDVAVPGGELSVKRLLATSGSRSEPITYWIRVGAQTVTGMMGQRLAQLKRGLTGDVPDGLIFRVSTIGGNTNAEFGIQDKFIMDLLNSVSPQSRQMLTGVAPGATASASSGNGTGVKGRKHV